MIEEAVNLKDVSGKDPAILYDPLFKNLHVSVLRNKKKNKKAACLRGKRTGMTGSVADSPVCYGTG